MKTKILIAGIIGMVALSFVVLAAPYEKRSVSRGYMRQKLAYSQGILEGLTLEKFDLVTKNAIRIRGMNLTNVWYWQKNPDYMGYLKNYQRNIDRLLNASTDKDLDKSTGAYQTVIQSCVECHRHFPHRTATAPSRTEVVWVNEHRQCLGKRC
jgi:hypothetical protein